MTTMRGRLLLRSLPVLFALFVAFFMPPAASATNSAPTVPAASGATVAAFVDSGLVDRTAAATPARTVEPVAEPLTATPVVADRARALTAQSNAGAASSRAPPGLA